MAKFIVDERLFSAYEGLKIGLVVCKGINNEIENEAVKENIEKEMVAVKQMTKEKFAGVELAGYPIIRKWRDIYKSFGEKKSRSSVEALIRRTVNGKEIPSINPLVDIYNVISLKYELPCGGEDMDCFQGDVELTYAKGTEQFLPLGEENAETVNDGEIVYKCGEMVLCRNFNYRESDITKLTEDTKNAVLVIEDVMEESADLEHVLCELAEKVAANLGGETRIVVLDREQNQVEL